MKKINLKKYSKIIFCGIGGSAVSGEIVKALNYKKPVLIAREALPASANSKSLCFVTSYSGNTNETLRLYKQAKKKKCKIIIITSGGKLSKFKEEKIILPKEHLPREALIYMLIPVLEVLKIKLKNPLKIIKKINKIKAKLIAFKLKNKMPLIYASSESLKIVAETWETLFNENSKILAHSDYFPQLAHNEIEAKLSKKHKVILLIDKETKQIQKAKKFLKPIKIKLKGSTLLEKIIYGIYLGDLVSIYLAKQKHIDYEETKKIKELK